MNLLEKFFRPVNILNFNIDSSVSLHPAYILMSSQGTLILVYASYFRLGNIHFAEAKALSVPSFDVHQLPFKILSNLNHN